MFLDYIYYFIILQIISSQSTVMLRHCTAFCHCLHGYGSQFAFKDLAFFFLSNHPTHTHTHSRTHTRWRPVWKLTLFLHRNRFNWTVFISLPETLLRGASGYECRFVIYTNEALFMYAFFIPKGHPA